MPRPVWFLWAMGGCSSFGDNFTFKIGDEEITTKSYSCSVDPEGWSAETTHDATYSFEGHSWACTTNAIAAYFYLEVGFADEEGVKDWQYFYGAPPDNTVWTALNKGIGYINRSGADVMIRLSPTYVSGQYGKDNTVNVVYPSRTYGSTKSGLEEGMAYRCWLESDGTPTACHVVVYQKYFDAYGHQQDIPWKAGSGAPGTDEYSMWTTYLHEGGHVVGLGHYEGSGSIMNSTISNGETRTPNAMDVEALVWLYGVR